jgi:hypothetical protein
VGIDSEKDYLDKIAIPRIKDVIKSKLIYLLQRKR